MLNNLHIHIMCDYQITYMKCKYSKFLTKEIKYPDINGIILLDIGRNKSKPEDLNLLAYF